MFAQNVPAETMKNPVLKNLPKSIDRTAEKIAQRTKVIEKTVFSEKDTPPENIVWTDRIQLIKPCRKKIAQCPKVTRKFCQTNTFLKNVPLAT